MRSAGRGFLRHVSLLTRRRHACVREGTSPRCLQSHTLLIGHAGHRLELRLLPDLPSGATPGRSAEATQRAWEHCPPKLRGLTPPIPAPGVGWGEGGSEDSRGCFLGRRSLHTLLGLGAPPLSSLNGTATERSPLQRASSLCHPLGLGWGRGGVGWGEGREMGRRVGAPCPAGSAGHVRAKRSVSPGHRVSLGGKMPCSWRV